MDTKATFTAQLEKLEEMLSWVRRSLIALGVSEDSLNDIELACEEALVNIIKYSYPEKTGQITLSCGRGGETGTALVVTLVDQGVPHNPLHSVHLPSPPRIGGYGIYLIVRLMDHVHYRYINGNNELTLIKYGV